MTDESSVEVLTSLDLTGFEDAISSGLWSLVFDDAVSRGADSYSVAQSSSGSKVRRRTRRKKGAAGVSAARSAGASSPIQSAPPQIRSDGSGFVDINLYRGTEWVACIADLGDDIAWCSPLDSGRALLDELLELEPDLQFDLIRVESC